MSETPEDAWLIALGAAVSDGAAVDWDRLEQQATDSHRRRLLRQMRGVASIVDAHRSDALSQHDTDPASPADLPPARNWGHIVLFEPIGSGAYATVYRGWDPALDREVAVKIFCTTENTGASPLEEARHLARIRHTNVVTVYGADREGDESGIWMEYLEGRTLAEMVRGAGPLSAREVAGVGVDLCRALAALHSAGLLHRDIKAQNVMRELGGRIVLMDFSGAESVADEHRSPVTSGTPLYMAPELLEQGTASFASDVYSLGVLLFFLVSGDFPVQGKTVGDLRRAHAQSQRRRLRDLRPDLPDSMVHVIECAIAADPVQRYQSVSEFEHALLTASGSGALAQRGNAAPVAPGFVQRHGVWLAVLAATLVAIFGVAATHPFATPPAPGLLTRFTIGPPFTAGSWPRVSPDGRFVVFGAIVEGRNRLWVRALDDLIGRPLMNTAASETPFWSPDSASLCFFDDGKLKRISIGSADAQPEVLAEAPQPHGGSWYGQSILIARAGGIYRIDLEKNAEVSQVTRIDQSLGDFQHGWPEFLPDGRRFLFVNRSSRTERTGIYVASIDGDAPRLVMPAFSRVKYVDGHLVFVRQGMLMAQRFNRSTASLEGEPATLANRIRYHPASDAAFDLSDTGVLIYNQSSGEPTTRLMLFDGRGRELEPLAPSGHFRHPRFSPDGRRVVAESVDDADGNVDLWMYDLSRKSVARLTSTAAPDVRPTWSPDGRQVIFSSKRGNAYEVYAKAVDTTESEQSIATPPGDKFIDQLSADGRYLSGTLLRSGLWIFPLNPAEKPWRVRADAKVENWQSEFSPDVKWFAYTSSESGGPEVYVEPFPATGARWQVSTHGGAQPHWRSRHELVYLGVNGTLMSTSLTHEGWQNSSPIPLFHINVPDVFGSGDYTVSADGERIVVNTFISDPVVPPIDVVVNWEGLLKK